VSRVVIVGSSVAGVRTAQALRSEGYDGDVVLLGEETDLPYDKPPLSKAMLAGTTEVDAMTLLTEGVADAAGIRLMLGHRAVGVDVADQVVEIQGGTSLPFDRLVVATGARARPSPWGRRPGVHLLRTLHDAQVLRADLLAGGPVVVVGGGFIGAEVASTARTLGLDVTIVDPLALPMSRTLDAEVGELFLRLHRRNGVRARFGLGVESIDGDPGALRLALTDGTVVETATVVVGIGAEPNDDWLRASGLVVDDGLVCDRYGRAEGADNIFAVGDVARWFHPDRCAYVRTEHWTNAVEQGACVAHNITHPDRPRSYAPVEYVWSDQYDWKLQIAGRAARRGRPVLIGDPDADNRFAALYSEDGRHLSGAAVVNWPRAFLDCRRALRDGAELEQLRARVAGRSRAPNTVGARS
jgi:NADPH-dependent 2,4-dienoyl-CoA reductase/sulfur reductase-like enzyme